MRALILYHLVQARAAELHRQAQREAPARPAGRACRTRTSRRGYRARGLPGVAARRVRAVLGGGSPGPDRAPRTRTQHRWWPAARAVRGVLPGGKSDLGRSHGSGPRGPGHWPPGAQAAATTATPGPAGKERAVNRTGRIGGCLACLARYAGVRPDPPWFPALPPALAAARPGPLGGERRRARLAYHHHRRRHAAGRRDRRDRVRRRGRWRCTAATAPCPPPSGQKKAHLKEPSNGKRADVR